MAVGTGFGQVFRGLGDFSHPCRERPLTHLCTGQVCGVAVSSALFQSKLNSELRARIHTPDADEVSGHMPTILASPPTSHLSPQIISRIRHSTTLVARLDPELQRAARDSYAVSLRAVFLLAACSTLLAYIVRLPVSPSSGI